MSIDSHPLIIWFRQDLRISDNPTLEAARLSKKPVIACFILDDKVAGIWALGGAARWWLHHALKDLANSLSQYNIPLILRKGDSLYHLQDIIKITGANHVVWNRRTESFYRDQDTSIKAALKTQGIDVKSFNARLLIEPMAIKNGSGEPFRVFTPFWKNVMNRFNSDLQVEPPLSAPDQLIHYTGQIPSDSLESLNLLPTAPDWSSGFYQAWHVSEKAAQDRLYDFVQHAIHAYKTERDFPNRPFTSRLSPYLSFGQISPRQCWHVVRAAQASGAIDPAHYNQSEHFITELGWREFAYHLLYHFPETPLQPLSAKFIEFPWREAPDDLHAWQKGQTGYPLVDAGMRQLWQTGWMHNRLRMVVGSFLVKHLLLPWQTGAQWFWDTLVDADLASNTLGWQWVGGCGADAAPYFRIFNPILQSKRFDADGGFIRQFVPELKELPSLSIHTPWEVSPLELRQHGVILGHSYPEPIVDHEVGRQRALEALSKTKILL
jgi:deoxyribodipyrimidine photo-lyase